MDQGLNLIYKRVTYLVFQCPSVKHEEQWRNVEIISKKKQKAFLFGVLITDKDKKRND